MQPSSFMQSLNFDRDSQRAEHPMSESWAIMGLVCVKSLFAPSWANQASFLGKTGDGWDISIDNLKELAPPELFPASYPASHDPLSGAGTSGIGSLQWKVVDGGSCDQHWDGAFLFG
jgi:hypothetical protein